MQDCKLCKAAVNKLRVCLERAEVEYPITFQNVETVSGSARGDYYARSSTPKVLVVADIETANRIKSRMPNLQTPEPEHPPEVEESALMRFEEVTQQEINTLVKIIRAAKE